MAYSEYVGRLLSQLDGKVPEQRAPRHSLPTHAAPVVRKTRDPAADVIDLVELMDEPTTRAPNQWLQRQRGRGQVGRKDSGLITFEGRRCCIMHLRRIDRRLHLIRLPYSTECGDCGAEYTIEMGVTEHGRH